MVIQLTRLTAAGIARRIKDGNLSPREVVDAHLDSVRERNDRTNAPVAVTDEMAREMAADAERDIEDGEQTYIRFF